MTEDEMLAALRLLPGTTVVTASEEAGAPAGSWGDSFAIYGPDDDLPQGWVSIVRPGPRTGERLRRLVAEAHATAVARWERRHA